MQHLDVISAAADTDVLRMPKHKSLFCDISNFKKPYCFFLKGEQQKLEPHLNPSRKAAFDAICEDMEAAVRQANCETSATDAKEIAQSFQDIYEKITAEAGTLGIYGDPVQFIADEIRRTAALCQLD